MPDNSSVAVLSDFSERRGAGRSILDSPKVFKRNAKSLDERFLIFVAEPSERVGGPPSGYFCKQEF